MMEVIEKTDVEGTHQEGALGTEEAKESGAEALDTPETASKANGLPIEALVKRGPKLTDEQLEWLNKVFIPNFRTELMRTLKAEDFFGGKREKRAAKERKEKKAPAASPDSRQGEAGEEKAAQRVPELEGEIKRLRGALAETRVDRELVWAAASQHAINPAQVAHLLKDRVRLDENLDPIVVNAHGDRLHDRYGRPVPVADAVRTFLEKNPHLVQPRTQLAGGGSGGTDATAMARRMAAVTGGDLIEEALREGE